MKWIVVRPQFKWQLWDFTRQAVQRMWFVEKKYILSAPSWVPTSWLIKSHLTELGTWEFYYGCRHVNICFCNSYHIQNHNLLLKAITVSCMPLKGSSGRHTWSLSRSLVSSSKEVWWKKWPKKLQNCFCKIQNHNSLLKAKCLMHALKGILWEIYKIIVQKSCFIFKGSLVEKLTQKITKLSDHFP